MPGILTDQIETALQSGRINCIDLLQIQLPGETLYWSTYGTVPPEATGEGITYEARIKSIGPLTFNAGFSDAVVSISFVNDGLVKRLANDGVIWEQAPVSICRLFPDLDPEYNKVGSWDNPHWRGWIRQAPSFEDLSTMRVSSGFSELNRESLRRYERTDLSDLGSEQFPYDPLRGCGLPQIKTSGTATGGTPATLTTGDDLSEIKESWLIFVEVKKIIGRIVSATAGVVTVEDWFYGGETTEIIPASGDTWIAGPVYTSYDGMEVSCKNMGMFGPHAGQDENKLNKDTRRYFYALNLPGKAYLEKRVPVKGPASSLSSVEGEGLDGEVIPVRFGEFEVDVKPLAWGLTPGKILGPGIAEKPGFFHLLGPVGEGRCQYLGEPLLDGVYHVDDINRDAPPEDDSWIEGGTEYPGANDQAGVDEGELTQSQQKQAIGSRQARARQHGETLDTYKGNPLGFNGPSGSGCSLAGLTWSRGRWQEEGYSPSGEPLVKIRGRGIKTLKPSGEWTEKPSVIEAFYYYLLNLRWGVKFGADQLNVADFTTQGAIAGEIIPSAGSEPKVIKGSLVAGPDDADAPTLPPCCVLLPASLPLGETREDGLICTITTTSKTYTMIVRGEASLTGPEIMSWIPTPEGENLRAVISDVGWLLVFYSSFDGEIPAAGDAFTLSGEGLDEECTMRYRAVGSLVADKSYGKTAEDIMRNCNGTFFQKRGRISPIIRGPVDLEVINARRTYTDKGAKRNVIFSGGQSTFKFTPADPSKSPTAIPTGVRVEFVDTEHGYQKREITIRNPYAEKRIKALTGIAGKSVTVLDLCLTGSAEQAVRLGNLYLRAHSFLPEVPGYHPGEYSLEVPIHDAQDLFPVEDVYQIYGGNFPYWCRYMRIEGFSDNSARGTVTIKGSVYLEEMYSDSITDFIVSLGPVIKPSGPGAEFQQLTIATLIEGVHRDDEGVLKVSVSGEITLP